MDERELVEQHAAGVAAQVEAEYEREPGDEYVKDQVCPQCGSRIKADKKAGLIYCTSMVCTWMKEIVGW